MATRQSTRAASVLAAGCYSIVIAFLLFAFAAAVGSDEPSLGRPFIIAAMLFFLAGVGLLIGAVGLLAKEVLRARRRGG